MKISGNVSMRQLGHFNEGCPFIKINLSDNKHDFFFFFFASFGTFSVKYAHQV